MGKEINKKPSNKKENNNLEKDKDKKQEVKHVPKENKNEKEVKDLEMIPSEAISEENNSSSTINTVKISNDAVAMYVGIALEEIQGVYGTVGAFAGITEAISGKKNYTKGVKVDVTESTAKIDVNIIVEYGARIPEVAFEIQNNVKKSVETMTGLKVAEVNVNIQGVHAITDKDEKEEVKEENE